MTRYAEGPAASPGFLLWHVTLRWQRAIGAALRPLDLTHVQFVLLACAWWLGERGTTPNQLELARQAGTDVKMTSQVLRKLEAKGLLRRDVDGDDTRARRVRLTPKGTRLAKRAIAAVENVDAEFFGREARAVTPVLQRLAGVAQATRAVDARAPSARLMSSTD
jgi:DNA-binding MarR family transcriptional regulator